MWPITSLTSFSNILEKVINWTHTHIYICCTDTLIKNNILVTEQYGFRHNSSNKKASFKLISNILLALTNKLTVVGIFCDLEKAFNSINHDMLLSKCEFYGFRAKPMHCYDHTSVINIREY
jgi:hypothetical protein